MSNPTTPGTRLFALPAPSLWAAAAMACLLLAVLFSIRPIAESDVGYHLKAGEWMLQNKAVPRLDPFTYSVPRNEYIDLHWLYQVLLFLLWKARGYDALSLFTAAVILAVFALTYARIRNQGVPTWTVVPVLLAAVTASGFRFMVRPECFSWLFLSLVLYGLERDASGKKAPQTVPESFQSGGAKQNCPEQAECPERSRGTKRVEWVPLWLIPILHVLWANMQGLFILGWIAVGAYALSAWVHDRRRALRLTWVLALSVLACLFNPYGIQGLLFPATLYARLGEGSVFKDSIREFASPWVSRGGGETPSLPHTLLYTYRAYSAFFFLLCALTFRRRKLHEFLAPAAFFYLSAVGLRNIPLFMLAAAPTMVRALGDLPRLYPRLQRGADFLGGSRALSGLSVLFILALGSRVVTGAWYVSDRSEIHFALGLDPIALPVRAAEFLRERMPQARLLNHLNTGGWLDWRFPGKTFIDGRLEVMGEEFYKTFLASSRDGGLQPLADRYQADAIVYPYQEETSWTTQLERNPAWRMVFFDETTAVFARVKSFPALPETSPEEWLASQGIPLPTPEQAGAAWNLPVPNALGVFLEGFYRKTSYPHGLFRAGYYCLQTRRYDAAEAIYAWANHETGGRYYEVYFNAAYTYYVSGRMEPARVCAAKALAMNPRHPMLRALAARLDAPAPR